MSIRAFHDQLFAEAKASPLFEALKRFALLEDPEQLEADEVTSGWIIWQQTAVSSCQS